jgi:hypothetical protein
MNVGEDVTLSILRKKNQPLQDIKITLAEQPKRPNMAKRFFDEKLGLSVRELTFIDAYARRLGQDAKGVVVAFIRPQSAAETGGLKGNDLVTQLNGEPVTDLEQFHQRFDAARKDKPKDAVDTTAMTSTDKVTEPPVPTPTPVPDTAPVPVPGEGSGSAEVPAIADTGSAGSAATQDVAAKTKTGKRTTPSKTTGKAVGSGAQTAVAETKVEPPKAIDASTLASQYKNVGEQLKALDDAKGRDENTDLWARYRFIRLGDAMGTQAKRDEAAAILSKLTADIATRKK